MEHVDEPLYSPYCSACTEGVRAPERHLCRGYVKGQHVPGIALDTMLAARNQQLTPEAQLATELRAAMQQNKERLTRLDLVDEPSDVDEPVVKHPIKIKTEPSRTATNTPSPVKQKRTAPRFNTKTRSAFTGATLPLSDRFAAMYDRELANADGTGRLRAAKRRLAFESPREKKRARHHETPPQRAVIIVKLGRIPKNTATLCTFMRTVFRDADNKIIGRHKRSSVRAIAAPEVTSDVDDDSDAMSSSDSD